MKRKCEFRKMGYNTETGRKAYGCTKHEVVCNSKYRCQDILCQFRENQKESQK
jgi:hypothetical protein